MIKFALLENNRIVRFSNVKLEDSIEIDMSDIVDGFDGYQYLKSFTETKEYKKLQNDYIRIAEIKQRLDELNKDFIQAMLGAVIPDIEEKKAAFISLHNELRKLEGKEPREYEV